MQSRGQWQRSLRRRSLLARLTVVFSNNPISLSRAGSLVALVVRLAHDHLLDTWTLSYSLVNTSRTRTGTGNESVRCDGEDRFQSKVEQAEERNADGAEAKDEERFRKNLHR